MTIETRKVGDVTILALEGQLDFGPAIALLEQRFGEAVDAGERLFLFDLLRVPLVDSSGVGQVVACHQAIRPLEGVVKLVLADRSRKLFEISRLEKMFEIYDGVDEALASFERPGGGYRARY